MRKICTAAVLSLIAGLSSSFASAEDLDELLNLIDADISAQRLSSPANNNAVNKINRFRAEAPFDYRVLPYSYKVAEAYISFADKALASGKPQKAQNFLDKAWSAASLAEGLDEAQSKVDKAFGKKGIKPKQQVAKKKPKPKPKTIAKKPAKAKPKTIAKKTVKAKPSIAASASVAAVAVATISAADKAATAAKLTAQIAAAKKENDKKAALIAKKKADAAALKKLESDKRFAAQKKVDEENSRLAAEKLAKQRALQKTTGNPINAAVENSAALELYDLDQGLIDNRSRSMKVKLKPICQEVVDNNYSVVFHTQSVQDYRWLLLRMKLCMRKIDKSVRLRHSNVVNEDGTPSVALHPERTSSLLRQNRN